MGNKEIPHFVSRKLSANWTAQKKSCEFKILVKEVKLNQRNTAISSNGCRQASWQQSKLSILGFDKRKYEKETSNYQKTSHDACRLLLDGRNSRQSNNRKLRIKIL